ncbi:MAG TPA: hypothetical protein VGO47_02875 [Chlamydiales bacterium]|nr:hypothetical protein [Chlamydiales bacterium]
MFTDYARAVESLAKKFPDIKKRQVVNILWEGTNSYIRTKWIDKGCDPEVIKWDKLVEYGLQYEQSEIQRKKEELRSVPVHTKKENRVAPRPPMASTSRHACETVNKITGEKGRKPPSRDKGHLNREEVEQLRAEGRCFNCKKEGHNARNCPDR